MATRSGTGVTPMVDVTKVARRIEAELKRAGRPERAVAEKRYLKSDLAFLGVALGDMRRVAKSVAEGEQAARPHLIVEELWRRPVFERRMVAVLLLELNADGLGPRDLGMIERLLRESKTWALVDGLAKNVVGRIALRHGIARKLDNWARDEDFWIRRSSLLAELVPLKNGAPFDRFARRADLMLDEKEFFIRKAIGWVLRETSKQRPREVHQWLASRTDRASGVTMREAVKYLDAKQASSLMRAYKEGRPAAGEE
jgi:3-methyladenine DNA glycosylase AlkD